MSIKSVLVFIIDYLFSDLKWLLGLINCFPLSRSHKGQISLMVHIGQWLESKTTWESTLGISRILYINYLGSISLPIGYLRVLLFFFFNLFFYFWLCWVFVAVCGLSLVMASGGYSSLWCAASHCSGFSCRARALGTQASVVMTCGLSSCGSWALEHRLSSCGARA